MFITSSNILLNSQPSVIVGASANDARNIVDPDFSTLYQSTNNTQLVISFGGTSSIDYVAFAGTNIKGNSDFLSSFVVRDGGSVVATTFVKYDNCCVVSFPRQSFSDLTVELNNPRGNLRPLVRFISAGRGFIVPNDGENAGYNRQFLNRNVKNRTSINDLAAPVASLKTKVSAVARLNLPNMSKSFSENEWQDFLNFAVSNHFFVREQDNQEEVEGVGLQSFNNSAYLCYDIQSNSVTAHQQTRELNNIQVSFKVFNGL
jgi:hypothetical protein